MDAERVGKAATATPRHCSGLASGEEADEPASKHGDCLLPSRHLLSAPLPTGCGAAVGTTPEVFHWKAWLFAYGQGDVEIEVPSEEPVFFSLPKMMRTQFTSAHYGNGCCFHARYVGADFFCQLFPNTQLGAFAILHPARGLQPRVP